jgi:diguanylate cyclase (GGDEF)-like protein
MAEDPTGASTGAGPGGPGGHEPPQAAAVGDAILRAAAALTSSLVPAEALAAVARCIGEALDVSSVDIWAYARDRNAVTHEAMWERDGGPDDRDAAVGSSISLDERPDLRKMLETGHASEVHSDDPDLSDDARASAAKLGYKTTLGAPLTIGDEVLGIVGIVETREVRRFSDDERRLFEDLCRFAAIGIHHAEQSRRGGQHKRHLVSLLESSRSLTASRDADQTIIGTKAEIAALLPWRDCVVDVFLRGEGATFARFGDAAQGAGAAGTTLPSDDPAAQAVELCRPVLVRAAGRMRLIVPLVFGNEASGYFDLSGQPERQVTRDEIEFVQILANHTAVAVENARLCRTVVRQAATDGVTRLYNRWFFFERLYSEAARANRYGEPLSVIMVAVDDFAAFCERRGASAGDAVLRGIGRLVNVSLRHRVDVACRTGDAEFGILLPKTPCWKPGAALVAERLRTAVEQTEFRDDEHDLLGRFTLCLGVAGFPDHAEDADELVAAADEALASARERGSNRVSVFSTRS